MFTTQEAVTAEIDYRMEQARAAAVRAQVERPSLLRRLLTKTPRSGPRVVTRGTAGTALSARI